MTLDPETIRLQRRNEIMREWEEADREVSVRFRSERARRGVRRESREDKRMRWGVSGELEYNREVAKEELSVLDFEVINDQGGGEHPRMVLDRRNPRNLLPIIAWWEQRRSEDQEDADMNRDRRDEAIKSAMAANPKLPRVDIARAARVEPSRLYQIVETSRLYQSFDDGH